MDFKSGSRSSPVGRAIPVPRTRRFLVTSQIKPGGSGDENEAEQDAISRALLPIFPKALVLE